jgi:hypothetical protein
MMEQALRLMLDGLSMNMSQRSCLRSIEQRSKINQMF